MKRFLMDLSVDGCGHSANLSLVESYVSWLERRHVAAVLRREHASPNLFTEIYCHQYDDQYDDRYEITCAYQADVVPHDVLDRLHITLD